jgi:hypothetical protein
MTPFLKGVLRYLGQEGFPVSLEADASVLEAGSRAVSVLTRMQAGIKAATPCHRSTSTVTPARSPIEPMHTSP